MAERIRVDVHGRWMYDYNTFVFGIEPLRMHKKIYVKGIEDGIIHVEPMANMPTEEFVDIINRCLESTNSNFIPEVRRMYDKPADYRVTGIKIPYYGRYIVIVNK